MTNSNPQPDQGVVRGFDVLMENGTDFIFDTNPSTDEDDGEEAPPPTPRWDDVDMDIIGDAPDFNNGEPILNGFRYSFRYYELIDDVDNPGEFIKSYGTWNLVSQTITRISPSNYPFLTNNGDEIFPIPSPQSGTVIGQGGIKDGSQYGYLQVFDQGRLSYRPRCSTFYQPPVEGVLLSLGPVNSSLPYPYYPMDTVNALIPDPRERVTVQYRVDTTYRAGVGNQEYNHSIILYQDCVQSREMTREKMQAVLDKCYFTHGFYHNQLYETHAPNNYNSQGEAIGPVIEPQYEVDQEATDLVGFTVYKLVNSVWNQNGLPDIPQQEADSAEAEKDRQKIRDKEIAGLEGTMASTQANYTAEVENIEQNQKEYEEFVKANEAKKQSLLDNMLVMMNLPPTAVPVINSENLNSFIEEANKQNREEGN